MPAPIDGSSKYVMLDKLLSFDVIGWDFDGTLIDHPNAPAFHRFISEHPEKRHYIITFRTHGWQTRVFAELQKYPSAPPRECFTQVFNIDDKAWEAFNRISLRRSLGIYDGPLTPWEDYYFQWKGLMCKTYRIPMLIDDMRDHVLPGCERYDIIYFHPDEL